MAYCTIVYVQLYQTRILLTLTVLIYQSVTATVEAFAAWQRVQKVYTQQLKSKEVIPANLS